MRAVLIVFALFVCSAFAAVASASGTGSLAAGPGIFRQIPFSSITASNATGTLTIATDGTFTIYSAATVTLIVSPTGTWTAEDTGGVLKAVLALFGKNIGQIRNWTYTTLSGNFANVGSFSQSLAAGTYYFTFGTAQASFPAKNSAVTNFGVTVNVPI